MVKSQDFKEKIQKIISQDYSIEFLGTKFEDICRQLSDSKAEKIYSWILNVLEKKIQPISLASKQNYKDWKVNELLIFRYPFTISSIEYRILFVKVKNSIYIEFHLGDHNYYDRTRKELNLK